MRPSNDAFDPSTEAPLVRPRWSVSHDAQRRHALDSSESTVSRTLRCDNFKSLHVWLHLVVGAVICVYALVRAANYIARDTLEFAFVLHLVASGASSIMFFIMFLASALLHATPSYRRASAYLREFDVAMIFVQIAATAVADLAACAYANSTSANPTGAPAGRGLALRWQTYADPLLASFVPVVILFVARAMRSPSSTWGPTRSKTHDARRRWSRWAHHDGVLNGPRLLATLLILLQWVGFASFEARSLPAPTGWMLLSSSFVGTLLVIVFAVNDLHEMTDRLLASISWLACTPRTHVLWHLATSAAVIFTLAVRDVALELTYLSTIDVGPALV